MENIEGSKVYVKPDSVKITKNGILLLLDENWISVSFIEKDNNGIFFDLNNVDYRGLPCPLCGAPLMFLGV